MRGDRPSLTAAYVAFLRALGDRGLTTAEGFHDPSARSLLPPRLARALAWVAPAIEALPRQARARVVARVDLLVVRALAIDAELTEALGRGAVQVVVLGAGFDTRAHRMRGLERARVYEVDHPATQAVKRQRAANAARACAEVTYVACDFERDALAQRLEAAGHRAGEPTVWIWEGVTLYLDDRAIRSTLATIAERSARGSTLVVEYHDAEAESLDRVYSFVRGIVLTLWWERQIGARPQRVMHAELEAAGLGLEKDFALSEWGAAFARAAPSGKRRARLAVATPRG
jgi:methyltransferase (TIGR00027 family)